MIFLRILSFALLCVLCVLCGECLRGGAAFAQPGVEEVLQRGTALEDSGRVEQAVDVYRRLFLEHPERLDLVYRLTGTLVKAGRPGEAVALLKQRLSRAPTDGRAQLALGDAYFAMDRQGDAVQVWERLLDQQANAGVYALVASRYRARGLPERAVGTYLKGREKIGEPAAFAMELAGVYEEQRHYRDAVREYLLALKGNPQSYPMVEARALELGRQADAVEATLAALSDGVRAAPEDILRMRLLTTFSLSAGKPDAALAAFLALDRRDPQAEAVLLQVAAQCGEGRAYVTALSACRALIERFPISAFLPQAHLGAARAEEGLGHVDRALALYDEVRGRFPATPEAQEACFRAGEVRREGKRDPAGALAVYREALKIQMGGPWQRPAMLGIGACEMSLGDAAGARQTYELIVRMAPGSDEADEAAFRAAEAIYLQGQFAEAQRALEALINGPTTRNPVNDALELSDLIARGLEGAATYLQGYADADLLARRGKDEEAARAFEAFVVGMPKGPLADRALMAAARLKAGLGRYAEAAEVFRKVAGDYPDSPLAPEGRMQAALLYEERLGQFQEAIRDYEALMAAYPDGPQVDEARQRLRRLQERIRG